MTNPKVGLNMAAQQRDIREDVFDDLEAASAEDVAAENSQERFASDTSGKTLDATQMYLNEIGFSPLLSAEEEVHYARLALQGDEMGRRRMIESNLRLVVKISRRYVNRGLSLLDLIQSVDLGFRLTLHGGFVRR